MPRQSQSAGSAFRHVDVTGVGSTWTNSGDLTVGAATGTGTLTVSNGGTVSNGAGTIGANAGSTGTVTVDGVGSTWANSSQLLVGGLGTAKLDILNGGAVSSNQGFLGFNSGSNATMTVDGVGSTWTNAGFVYIGANGTASLTISNGGKVQNTLAIVGAGNGSGTVDVTGVGSTWTNSGDLTVGAATGTGTLTVSNGGTVSSVHGYLGNNQNSIGAITVGGAGSTWTNSGSLLVGNYGTGTLTISSGGAMSNLFASVGTQAGSTGTVTVDGVGSKWANSANLIVGDSGTGDLTISNGGKVTNAEARLGIFNQGSATVTGVGSTWINSGGLYVGDGGTGTLKVTNGGSLSNTFSYVGANTGSTGTATVDGAGASWTNTGNLIIGSGGTGDLTISNGGKVTNAEARLGIFNQGSATVAGVGSTWINSGDLYVGDGGTGTLTISSGGTVSVGSVARIAAQAGSVGTLNIGGAAGSAATAAGVLNAASVVFGSGTGTINFNHTDANYTFAPAMSGIGTINQLAGNTNLTADSSGFTGETNVTGGRLAVNGSLINSLVTVSGGGVLGGNGMVGGIAANAGGIIAPGNSIGTLSVNSNITQGAGSTYQVELTSTGLADRINATGTVTIANGATLNVVKLDAAPYVVGTHYTVLQANSGVSGTYALTGDTGTAFFGLVDHYDPTHVYLDIMKIKSFAAAGLTPNQIAAGGGTESLGAGNPLYDAVLMLPTDPVAQYAFDQLSGEVHASARTALIEDSRFIRNAVNDRIRAAFDGVGSSGTVTTYVDGKPVTVSANTDRLAVWGQGFGSWGHTEGDDNAARLNRSTGGFFIGADAPVFDRWRFGAVAGYSRTSFDVKDRHSSVSSDNYHVGLYGGTAWGDLAFRTGAAYTWHDISTNRNVMFPGFGDSLKGDYDAATAQVFGELAYGINAGSARFEPFANLAYVNLHTDGFTEKGGAEALTGASANTDATFTTLGLRASTTVDLGGARLTANGMVGWRHAFGDVTPLAAMRFAGGGDTFSIGGVPITRDAAVLEAGLDYAITPNATLGVSYNGQFGSGLSDQSVRANFNVKF